MELLMEVRHQHPHIAFLVTTGVDDVDVGVKAMRSGADDYLVKPLHESAVVASLESALQKRHLEQEVEHYHLHLEELVAARTDQLQAALHQIERSYEDTLQALGAAIDLRDNVFLNVPEDVWPALAKNQRRVAGHSPGCGEILPSFLPG